MNKIIEGISRDLLSIPEKLAGKWKTIKWKPLILLNVLYLLTGYCLNRAAWQYRQFENLQPFDRITAVLNQPMRAFQNPLPSLDRFDLMVGITCGIALKCVVSYKQTHAKKYRQGMEYGSARWGTPKDIEPFMDPDFQNNIPLTETERLMLNGRPSHPKYARNKNVLIIGGSGSGKTRFFVKPSLMQMHSSYVVTDPKGTVLVECGKMLQQNGYRIKVLNTINFKKSLHYNPFAYIRSEKDILKLVTTLMTNTRGEGSQAGEDFWQKAEKLYFTALMAYIWYEAPEEEQNFAMLLDMLDASETREDDENFKNAIDLLFDELRETEPDHFAVRMYDKYKLAAGVICSESTFST